MENSNPGDEPSGPHRQRSPRHRSHLRQFRVRGGLLSFVTSAQRRDLWRADAIVPFEWLKTVDMNSVPTTPRAEEQAPTDLLTRVERETDIPSVTQTQIDDAREGWATQSQAKPSTRPLWQLGPSLGYLLDVSARLMGGGASVMQNRVHRCCLMGLDPSSEAWRCAARSTSEVRVLQRRPPHESDRFTRDRESKVTVHEELSAPRCARQHTNARAAQRHRRAAGSARGCRARGQDPCRSCTVRRPDVVLRDRS
jgi:hypothetical protein